MSYSSTYSDTYTVVDVQKVWAKVQADFRMAAQSTTLITTAYVDKVMRDVVKLAEKGYISQVHIYLNDAKGKPVRGRTYTVSEDAGGWTDEHSGSMLWPKTSGGDLGLVVTYSQKWWDLSDAQRPNFKSTLELTWSTSAIDTSFPGLSGTGDRKYASKAYGVQSRSFS